MTVNELQTGDVVYAASTLYNDGGIPGIAANAVLAKAGSRGVIVNAGHLEQDPGEAVYLVRFEDEDLVLGPPVGCLSQELTGQPQRENP